MNNSLISNLQHLHRTQVQVSLISRSSSRRIWLFLIMLLGFAARLFRLGTASLWYDETVSLYLARQDLASLTRHTAGDIHPPLYYYLLHFWGQLAGWSEFSAAFVSLFFGMLLIALVYRVASDLSSISSPRKRGGQGTVGVIAAFLVAVSPYNLWYSQEVRMYTLGALLGLASIYLFVRMFSFDRRPAQKRGVTVPPTAPLSFDFASLRSGCAGSATDRRGSILTRGLFLFAYAVVTALGLYTLYYFIFLLVFENLIVLLWLARGFKSAIRNLKSEILTWFSSQLATLILYLPWLPIAFRQATNPPVPPWRGFTSLGDVLLESFSALALGQSVDWHSPVIWAILLVVGIIIIVALWPNREAGPLANYLPIGLLAFTLVPLLFIFIFSLWKPLYHVRYIFLYSPGFYVLLALGLYKIFDFQFSIFNLQITQHATRITHHALRFTSFAFLLLLTLASAYSAYNFWFDPRYGSDDLRGAVQRLAAEWRPGDAILLDAGYAYTAFDYYNDQPVAWRGRLVDYVPRAGDADTGAIVLQTGSIGGDKNLGWGSPESDFYATTADETRTALDRVFATHPRVWLLRLYDTVVDPDGIIRDYLATRGRIIDDQGFEGESFARVQGYITANATFPLSATSRRVLLGNRIALVGFEPNTATLRAGAPLDVNVYWQAQEPTNVDAHLFVGLFAENGEMITSSEEIPLGNAFGTSRWANGEMMREPVRLAIPRESPPGDYVLRVMLYNPLTDEPLTAENSAWVVEGSQIQLTLVHIQ